MSMELTISLGVLILLVVLGILAGLAVGYYFGSRTYRLEQQEKEEEGRRKRINSLVCDYVCKKRIS